MRQACEISTLREDVERLAHEAATLRDRVEEAVEDIRDRFAALSAEQLADAAAMAPLLQVAVTTLLEIREQTRRLNTRTGPVPDDDRSAWLAAADAPRVRPAPPVAPCAPARPLPPEDEPVPAPRAAAPLAAPSLAPPDAPRRIPDAPPPPPAAPAAPAASGTPAASWLASRPAPPPPPSHAATTRNGGPSPAKPGGIDWLGPAGR